jgi:hypothetical protein
MISFASATYSKKLLPWLAIAVIVLLAALLLRVQGRLWICRCGYVLLWSGDIKSSDNSQHIFDPYSYTHILHGFIFAGLLAWALPRLTWQWRLALAVVIEAAWEVAENTDAVIQRYREATLALGYYGDTILNSLSDIAMCILGVMIARALGFRRTAALFIITEIVLIVWIRDSLLLNILMLLFPIEAIKQWQIGR